MQFSLLVVVVVVSTEAGTDMILLENSAIRSPRLSHRDMVDNGLRARHPFYERFAWTRWIAIQPWIM